MTLALSGEKVVRRWQHGPSKGTRDWAKNEFSWQSGCSHDCLYCYGKVYLHEYGSATKTIENWHEEVIREKEVKQGRRKRVNRLMVPSSQDISPEHLDDALEVLDKFLNAGNDLIIVSKPHLECVKAICDRYILRQEQITFRFTIGSINQEVLSWWEPNAPTFEERMECLRYARDMKYKTSVSAEPMLYSYDIEKLVEAVRPYCNESIWLGRMRHLENILEIHGDVPDMVEKIEYIKRSHAPELLQVLKDKYTC